MGAEVGREAQVEVESSTSDHVLLGALRDLGGPAGACMRQSPFCYVHRPRPVLCLVPKDRRKRK